MLPWAFLSIARKPVHPPHYSLVFSQSFTLVVVVDSGAVGVAMFGCGLFPALPPFYRSWGCCCFFCFISRNIILLVCSVFVLQELIHATGFCVQDKDKPYVQDCSNHFSERTKRTVAAHNAEKRCRI